MKQFHVSGNLGPHQYPGMDTVARSFSLDVSAEDDAAAVVRVLAYLADAFADVRVPRDIRVYLYG